jgi:hypothetical protein
MEGMENGARYRIVNINGEVLNGVYTSNHKFVNATYKILQSKIKKINRVDGVSLVGDEGEIKDALIIGTDYKVETTSNETIVGIYDSKYIVDVVDGTHIHFLLFSNATVTLKKTGVQLESVVREEGPMFPEPLQSGPIRDPHVISADYGGKRTPKKRTKRK